MKKLDKEVKAMAQIDESNYAFSTFLKSSYLARKSRNASFSLRAFANFLGVDQSFLSKVLAGKKTMSLRSKLECLRKLGATNNEVDSLIDGRLPVGFNYRLIEEDIFTSMKDWWHFAILELIKTENFVPSVEYIAKRFGLSVETVEDAISRLFIHGFLIDDENGWALSSPDNTWSSLSSTSDARRALQRSYLDLSLSALNEVPVDYREHGSLTVAIDKTKLPEFKKAITDFRRALGNIFQNGEPLNEVYQLTVSFFPLTKDYQECPDKS